MFFWRLPFKRWSLLQHVLTGSLCVTLISAIGYEYLQRQEALLTGLQQQHQTLQSQIDHEKVNLPDKPQANFTEHLPENSRADDVARDISRFAQTLGVQIVSMSIENRPASNSTLGAVHFSLSLQAEYTACKAWLAELLGRYPTLAIQSLSFRGQPNDALRQEAQLVLVLFVKG
ncbi:MAG: Uncharacterized protein FD135_906 [Comamonadaceae bacterium]|nr:MAG: Uncharacterized protein FD135_906 [Comamonadaceae bacterium]